MRTRVKFQSTRPHGARRNCCTSLVPPWCFNPRARAGRDGPVALGHGSNSVSIHAPARGATIILDFAGIAILVSIHAPARGATAPPWGPSSSWQFQSTRPHGARRNFDPARDGASVSIHAPARGATKIPLITRSSTWFQSTRPHGARLRSPAIPQGCSVFQSTRPHGARRRYFHAQTVRLVSIHAPARGATWTRSTIW